MERQFSINLKHLVVSLTLSFLLIACGPKHIATQKDTATSPQNSFITDIVAKTEGETVTVTLYSNQQISYTSFAQQSPPLLVLDIPDVYLHKDIQPVELSEGPVTGITPEQISSEEGVKIRVTLLMKEASPYEISRGNNMLLITVSSAPKATETIETPSIEETASIEKSPVENLAETPDPPPSQALAPQKREILRSNTTPTLPHTTNAPTDPAEPEGVPKDNKDTGEAQGKNGLSSASSFSGKPISLDFQNADIRSVLRIIADVSGHNLVIDPEVTGKVDITLITPVPWDHALDVILKTNKLQMKMEGNIIRVGLPKTFHDEKETELKALETTRKAKEEAKKSRPLDTKITQINYAKANELRDKINPMLSQGEGLIEKPSIMVDDRTNTLIIKDLPEVIQEIMRVVYILDRPTPQVMIEARIVETNNNFLKDLGIQWGGNYSKETNYRFAHTVDVKGATTATDDYAVNLPMAGEAFGAIGLTLGHINEKTSLDIQLKAMEKSGKIKTLSNPRIATLDNKEAVITSGTDLPYQAIDKDGNPTTKFIDASTKLTVTPQITPDNNITMDIMAERSEPDWSNAVMGTPAIFKRQAKTNLIVRDGDTTVIGGLNKHNNSSKERKIPLLGDIPILGHLFKTHDRNDTFEEILIFITPRIIKPEDVNTATIEQDKTATIEQDKHE